MSEPEDYEPTEDLVDTEPLVELDWDEEIEFWK